MPDTNAYLPALSLQASNRTKMPATNETIQLRSIRAGDVQVFKALFEEKYPGLVRLACHYVREEAIAKDLVQQVFIRFWEKKETLLIRESIPAYLRQMVVNECLAHLRTQKRRSELVPSEFIEKNAFSEDADGPVLENELKAQIRDAVDTLPDKCKEIFRMSRYESMTYREIAEELNISTKTVENQVGIALKKLKYSLRKYLHFF